MMFRLGTAVLLWLLCIGSTVAQEEVPKPRVVKVSAHNLVNEFRRNTDAAVQKYLPPTENNPNGVLIRVTGVVAAADARNNEVALAGGRGRVILHATMPVAVQPGDTIKAVGVFGNYFRGTVLIYCDEVKLVEP